MITAEQSWLHCAGPRRMCILWAERGRRSPGRHRDWAGTCRTTDRRAHPPLVGDIGCTSIAPQHWRRPRCGPHARLSACWPRHPSSLPPARARRRQPPRPRRARRPRSLRPRRRPRPRAPPRSRSRPARSATPAGSTTRASTKTPGKVSRTPRRSSTFPRSSSSSRPPRPTTPGTSRRSSTRSATSS